MNFQDLIITLDNYWKKIGFLIGQPYGLEVGAGTANPHTFFRVLGPEPYYVAYVEPSRRPADGRYGENPNRLQHYYQYQIIMKPAPSNHLELYLNMLKHIGIKPEEHDIRFVEDNWASPSLRAWGLGWEVWLDSMEITQYTYFQQMGGIQLELPTVEITIGLERLSMYLQKVDDYKKIKWNNTVTYGELFKQHEYYQSLYNYEQATNERLKELMSLYFAEAEKLIQLKNFWVAYDYILKVSHVFNILDARGVGSATFRRELFNKIGGFLSTIANLYLDSRKKQQFPLQNKKWQINLEQNLKQTVGNDNQPKSMQQVHEQQENKQASVIEANIYKSSIIKNYYKVLQKDLDSSVIVELDFEEFPHNVLETVNHKIRQLLPDWLKRFHIQYKNIQYIITPRRIGFILQNIKVQEQILEIKGPPLNLLYDKNGQKTDIYGKFINKLVNKFGQEKIIKEFEKDGFLYIQVKSSVDWDKFVAEFFDNLLAQLPFKYMHYKQKTLIRPLRSILVFVKGRLIDVAHINFKNLNNDFKPNHLMKPVYLDGGFVLISNINQYMTYIYNWFVLLFPEIREQYILELIKQKAEFNSDQVNITNEIKVLAMLNESPNVVIERVPEKFSVLPYFVIYDILWTHQKYIVLNNMQFVIVANNPLSIAEKQVRVGALKVALARLEDGLFYMNQDKGKNLSTLIQDSNNIMFGKRALGQVKKDISYLANRIYDEFKQQGMDKINIDLIQDFVTIWRSDLITALGKEFPNLEGKILAYYIENKWIKVDIDLHTNINRLIEFLYQGLEEVQQTGNQYHNNHIPLELLLLKLSYYLDTILFTVKEYGLPKGSIDKFDIKSYVDKLFDVAFFISQYLDQYHIDFDLMQFINKVSTSYAFEKQELEELYSFMKKRLSTYLQKQFSNQFSRNKPDQKKSQLLDVSNINLVNISRALVFTPGMQLSRLAKVLGSNKILDILADELFIEGIKRVYNILKKDLDFQNVWKITVIEWDKILDIEKQRLDKLIVQHKNILTNDDEFAYKQIQSLIMKVHDTDIVQYLKNGQQLLKTLNQYLDNVQIFTSDNNLRQIRQLILKLFLQYVFKMINIPLLIGQDFELNA